MCYKIVVLGPESTGKSTLCQQLAAYYNTLWCPEFARKYLLEHGTNYTFENLLTIAQGQWALEHKYVQDLYAQSLHSSQASLQQKDKPLLFVDTDQYVMKVWCEFVFNDCHTWILNRIAERQYDLYLLCAPDLPWVKDELREYPNEKPRQQLFHIYKDILVNQQVPWFIIKGNYEQRTQLAVRHINQWLQVNDRL